MTTAAVVELRNIRTGGIDDPERVVQIGRSILGKGGYGSAGDECTTLPTTFCNADVIPDWTIMDQVAVAALITGEDILAKVLLSTQLGVLQKGLYRSIIRSVPNIPAYICTRGNAT